MLGLVRATECLFVRCCAGKASDQRNTFSQAGYLAAAAATNALLKLNPSTIDRGATTHAFRNIKTFRTAYLAVLGIWPGRSTATRSIRVRWRK